MPVRSADPVISAARWQPIRHDRPTLSVVVPIYNEAETIPELYRRIIASVESLDLPAEWIVVNDGSQDRTTELLNQYAQADDRIVAIHLSRNFGHQAALSAGLDHAQGEVVVLLDGDLQDPPELIAAFLQEWRSGADVVYAVRAARPEGLLKRFAYWGYYRLLIGSNTTIPRDAGDFGLIDRKVVDVIRAMPERQRFLRGLRAYAGFRQVAVPFEREERYAGAPKFTLKKLFGLARSGLIGFTAWPIRAIGAIAACTVGVGVLGFIYLLASGTSVPGWVWIIVAMICVAGIQGLALAVLGEYLYRVLEEVTGRPTYVVRQTLGLGLERWHSSTCMESGQK